MIKVYTVCSLSLRCNSLSAAAILALGGGSKESNLQYTADALPSHTRDAESADAPKTTLLPAPARDPSHNIEVPIGFGKLRREIAAWTKKVSQSFWDPLKQH